MVLLLLGPTSGKILRAVVGAHEVKQHLGTAPPCKSVSRAVDPGTRAVAFSSGESMRPAAGSRPLSLSLCLPCCIVGTWKAEGRKRSGGIL